MELDWPHSIDSPPKPLLQNPNHSPFISNFVAMATRVGWGKILLAVFDGPTLKNPPIDTKISQVSLAEEAVADEHKHVAHHNNH